MHGLKLSKNTLAVLFFVWVAAWFGSIELRGLFIPDEGRYAEIPREMVASGDWVTPRLNDLKYFEKPPLQYWLTAMSLATFGDDEWSARLPNALLGFQAVLATAFAARRLWGREGAVSTTVVLASSWAFYLTSQYLTLDMTLTAFLTTALCSFLLAQRYGMQSGRLWMCAAWASCALAILSKGLIGVVLPALALVLYSAFARDIKVWRRLEIVRGVAILLVIVVPWFVLVQHRNPEFFDIFFVREHLQRFTSYRHQRYGPWWYYVPILLVGLMPWLPEILYQWLQRKKLASVDAECVDAKTTFRPDLFCIAWALAIVVFFSLSRSKLPAYVIPVFPALALLAGRRAFLGVPGVLRWCGMASAVVGATLMLGTSQLERWEKFVVIGPDAVSGLPWVYAATSVLFSGGLVALLLLRRGKLSGSVIAITVSSFAFWGLTFSFLQHVDAAFSSERLVEALVGDERPFAPHAPFYSLGPIDYSVPFYLGRPVTVVGHRGELDAGLLAEPDKWVESTTAFQQVWKSGSGRAYAVMRPESYDELMRAGLAMNLVARDRRLVVVSRDAANTAVESAALGY